MSLAIVHSRAQVGVEAPGVTVEVHLANGLPSLTLVGLPEAAVKESKDRVRSALLNAGFDFPARRIKCRQGNFPKNEQSAYARAISTQPSQRHDSSEKILQVFLGIQT